MASPVGKKIGNYIVTRLLGEGGMGAVYLAEHPDIGRRVAIKLLNPRLTADPSIAERFQAEAKAVTRIGHPCIIDVYDFGRTDEGHLYYVMEALAGSELRDVIAQKGRFTPDEIWPYLEQICAALEAAHQRNVVHRDLKPENIFVLEGQPLRVKILDFGIAKLLETQQKGVARTATGVIMGTPLFMAPEQAAGLPEMIGPQTDLYSLGVMLYWMLGGRPPFHSEAPGLLLAKHITDTPPPLKGLTPSLSDAVVAVIDRCLAKNPADRHASALDLLEHFSCATRGESFTVGARLAEGPIESPQPVEDTTDAFADPLAKTDVGEQAEEVIELTPKRGVTTLSGATGQMVSDIKARSSVRVVVIALLLIVAGGVTFFLLRKPAVKQGEQIAEHAAGTSLAFKPSAPPQDKRAAAVKPIERYTVTVNANIVKGTSCHYRLAKGPKQVLFVPCEIAVRGGQQIELAVVRGGFQTFKKTWIVTADRTLAVEVLRKRRRIVLAGTVARSPTPKRGRSWSSRSKKPAKTVPSKQPAGKKAQPAEPDLDEGARNMGLDLDEGARNMGF